MTRRGLSLLETLVAAAAVAVLLALVVPAVQRVREAAGRADCRNRLRNQGVAVLGYEAAHGRLPPGSIQGPYPPAGVPDGAGHSLWPLLLPHVGEAPLAASYHLDRPFDHADNRPASASAIKSLLCPNLPPGRVDPWDPPPGGAVADYAPVEVNPFLADIGLVDPSAGFEGALPPNREVLLTEITDGASQTLLLAEAGGRPGVAWSSPTLPIGVRQFFGGDAGPHRGGVHAVMADGSAHFLRDTMTTRVLAQLATRAGGEPADGF